MPEESLAKQTSKTSSSVQPFRGTVTAHLSDAIIASTRNALVLEEEGRRPAYFFPFEDIYFAFLEENPKRETISGRGIRVSWSGEAVGTAAEAVMWSYEEPEGAYVRVRDHGTFDPAKVDIDANPVEDREHTPHLP